MAELQPPPDLTQINGHHGLSTAAIAAVPPAAATTTLSGGTLLPNPAALPVTSSETVGSKRQRRPSVRLGDIGGDQPYEVPHSRRAPKPWKINNNSSTYHSLPIENRLGRETLAAAKPSSSSKTAGASRGLANFHDSDERERELSNNNNNLEAMAIGSWRIKDSSAVAPGARKRGGFTATKRVRSNWNAAKLAADEDADDLDNEAGGEENSESPANSGDERDDLYSRRMIRGGGVSRVSIENNDNVELMSGPSDTEAREWEGNGGGGARGEDGVRVWLNGLGLGRYAPVFEVHEVDDEVLPMLTLEDLKDMGINAVGSRRKMFCAIQKLGKGFS